jgi:hypothetical protein
MTTRLERKALDMIKDLLGSIIEVSPHMPVQQASAIILVALNEGSSMKELTELAGVKQSTMSRHLIDLGRRNRRMEQGYQVIECRQDDFDMRKNRYNLTPKGHTVVNKLLDTVKNYADIR